MLPTRHDVQEIRLYLYEIAATLAALAAVASALGRLWAQL